MLKISSLNQHINTNDISSDYERLVRDYKNYNQFRQLKKPAQHFNFGKCRVCKDKATGIHYGIPSCEGCKGFFKRSIEKNEKYVCYFGYKCEITPKYRKRCKYCRWKACIQAGMSFEAIKMGRIPRIKDSEGTSPSSIESNELKFKFSSKVKMNHFLERHRDLFSSVLLNKAFNSPNIDVKLLLPKNTEVENNFLLITCLRDKCYQLYVEFIDTYKFHYDKVKLITKNCSNQLNLIDPNDIPTEIFWKFFLNVLEKHITTSISFARRLPGFDLLNVLDFKFAVIDRTFMIIALCVSKLFVNDECYFFVSDNVYFKKSFMRKVYGSVLTDIVFTFHKKILALNLTDYELSILIPYLLSSSDKYTKFSNNDLRDLNKYYTQVLLYEFNLNNRSKEFYTQLKDAYALLPDLNKMHREVNFEF